MEKLIYNIDEEYMINHRRALHMHPELGFELPQTLALIRSELDKLGIEYTEALGKSSIVATINPQKSSFTIGVRADMDALPINEENDFPYKSQEPGKCHACGHDFHTAILLGVAKALNEIRDSLSCRVKLVFQACEEGPGSGAALLTEDGVMDDIDIIVAQHVDVLLKTGQVGIIPGEAQAASRPFVLEFFGKTSHGTQPQKGASALAMAVKAYNAIMMMQTTEVDPLAKKVLAICSLHSGTASNVTPDYARMEGTLRTFDDSVDSYISGRMEEIGKACAEEIGGSCKYSSSCGAKAVYNDPALCEKFIASASELLGKDNVRIMPVKLGSEDFSSYLQKKPGFLFRLGVTNEEKGPVGVTHGNKFMPDEGAMRYGAEAVVRFIIDNMNGVF